MKKDKNEYFGIYINNKIPKINNKKNKYYNNIKLDFKGKAFILKENKIDIQEELRSGKKYKKQGHHTIKFINENQEIKYIDIRIKKLNFIWLFLFALFFLLNLILFFYRYTYFPKNKQLFEETINYDIEMEGLKYVFNINYENENFQSVELTDKVTAKKCIYPGSSGSFYIVISTVSGNKDMFYKMKVKEEINKPTNLKFVVDGKIYNSIKELSENINGNISKNSNKTLKIDWFWDYNTNDDITDTFEGINIENYSFFMTMIGTTEGG